MKPHSARLCLVHGLLALVFGACASAPAKPVIKKIDFDQEVKPFFEYYCYQCHDAGKHRGGVVLTDKTLAMKHIVAGDPLRSDVYRAITRSPNASDHMPPTTEEQPEDAEIAMIKQWIAEGANWPDAPRS